MKRILSVIVLTIVLAITGGSAVFAAIDGSVSNGKVDGSVKNVPAVVKLDNPIKANSISELLLNLVDLAIYLGSIVAVLVFIYIGFKFVMAQGSGSELSDAKQWFMYAVIGTALLVSSKVVVVVVQNTLISAGLVNQQQISK